MDIESLEKNIDIGMMKEQIFSMPNQIEQSFSIISKYSFNSFDMNYSNILICGMGGSAISGDFVKSILSNSISIPIVVNRSYYLPSFVSKKTLVIISSYSGNTEETISCFNSSLEVGCDIICISSGGYIQKVCNDNEILCIKIPKGYQPRAAIGYSLSLLLLSFNKIKLCPDSIIDNLKQTISTLREFIIHIDEYAPSMIDYAKTLKASFPIIYGSDSFGSAIAFRFRCQLAENSKILSSCFEFPEQNHNEIEGFVKSMDQDITIIWILNDIDHPQVKKRMNIVSDILTSKVKNQIKLSFNYSGRIESVFSAILYTDIISYYLAIISGIDPTPVDIIATLKKKM